MAAEIESLLAGRRTVWAADEQRYRELRPSDVAILLRRLANLHTFEQSLELRGIPYQTPRGAGFFTRPEVMDLTNLLGWLAEPEDEMALAGALRSPLFMVDDPTLLRLREGHRSIAAGLAAPPDPAAPTDSERQRRHAWRVLSRLRQEAGREPVAELLERCAGRERCRGGLGAPRRRRPGARQHPQARGDGSHARRVLARRVRRLSRRATRRAGGARGAGRSRPLGRRPADDRPCRQGAGVPGRLRARSAPRRASPQRGDQLASPGGDLRDAQPRARAGSAEEARLLRLPRRARRRGGARRARAPPLRGGDARRRLPLRLGRRGRHRGVDRVDSRGSGRRPKPGTERSGGQLPGRSTGRSPSASRQLHRWRRPSAPGSATTARR